MKCTRREWIRLFPSAAALANQVERQPIVGCQANAWPLESGHFDQLISAVRDMKKLGYVGFECNIRFVEDEFPRADAARQELERTGLSFIGAHSSLEQWSDRDLEKAAKGVASLGAQRMILSAKGLSSDGHFTKSALALKVSRIEVLAKIARAQGIRVAYHNHMAEFANNNAEQEALANALDPEFVDYLILLCYKRRAQQNGQ